MTKRRRRIVGGIAVVLGGGMLAAFAVVRQPPSGLDRARSLVADDERFETAQAAGLAFVKVSRILLDAGEECADERGEDDDSCAVLFATSGFAQVAGVHVLRCTQPGIFQTRAVMRHHLAKVADAFSRGELVRAPELPECG